VRPIEFPKYVLVDLEDRLASFIGDESIAAGLSVLLATYEGRACPGAYGMILVDMLRRDLGMKGPK
jgi:hypothetical protein